VLAGLFEIIQACLDAEIQRQPHEQVVVEAERAHGPFYAAGGEQHLENEGARLRVAQGARVEREEELEGETPAQDTVIAVVSKTLRIKEFSDVNIGRRANFSLGILGIRIYKELRK